METWRVGVLEREFVENYRKIIERFLLEEMRELRPYL